MNDATDLFTFAFKGHFLEEKDLPRINTHARRIWDCMTGRHLDQQADWDMGNGWIELNALSKALGIPHSSLSACVRAFRFAENGGHKVERAETPTPGLFLYRLTPNTPLGVTMAKQSVAKKPKGTQAYRDGYRDALLEIKGKMADKAKHNSWWLGSKDCGTDVTNMLIWMIEENCHE